MLRKQPADRPSGSEVLAFINAQLGFAQGASMPHAIVKRPSGAIVPPLPEPETLSRATGQGDAPTAASNGRKRLTRLSLAFTALIAVLVVAAFVVRSFVGKGGAQQGGAIPPLHPATGSSPQTLEAPHKSDLPPPPPEAPKPAAAPSPVEEKGARGKTPGKSGKRRPLGKTKNADIELLK